jgi:hypothetical protein
MNPYCTSIRNTIRTKTREYTYQYYGEFDDADRQELLQAIKAWDSYDADQKEAVELRLNIVSNDIFKPVWGQTTWLDVDWHIYRVERVTADVK